MKKSNFDLMKYNLMIFYLNKDTNKNPLYQPFKENLINTLLKKSNFDLMKFDLMILSLNKDLN
jgi:hypothetical protein